MCELCGGTERTQGNCGNGLLLLTAQFQKNTFHFCVEHEGNISIWLRSPDVSPTLGLLEFDSKSDPSLKSFWVKGLHTRIISGPHETKTDTESHSSLSAHVVLCRVCSALVPVSVSCGQECFVSKCFVESLAEI